MSTANVVPETYDLTGDDAWEVLSRTGRGRLLGDAFLRLRLSDGFSHARAMAFATTLVIVQGLIALVGLAGAVGEGKISQLIVRSLQSAVPGPAGRVLTQAVKQAHQASSTNRYTALVIGLVGALLTGATAMGQLERGLNRLYGVEQDRPTLRKYGRAFVLTFTAGVLASAAFAALAFGRAIASALDSDLATTLWETLRWPVALLLAAAAVALLFRWSPRRRQPGWSWLAFGSVISVVLWALSTLALALFFQVSSTFGDTYGPLAGIIALMVWALLSSIAWLYGASVSAQLEAVRAGYPAVQDPRTAAAAGAVPAAR
jgi:YihY family inner membrane protein